MGAMKEAKSYYEAYRDEVPAHERSGDSIRVEEKIAEIEGRLKDPGWDNRDFWQAQEWEVKKVRAQNWWRENWKWVVPGGVAVLGVAIILRRRK